MYWENMHSGSNERTICLQNNYITYPNVTKDAKQVQKNDNMYSVPPGLLLHEDTTSTLPFAMDINLVYQLRRLKKRSTLDLFDDIHGYKSYHRPTTILKLGLRLKEGELLCRNCKAILLHAIYRRCKRTNESKESG